MSLELSIFQRLLQEAVLSQSEFLDKVNTIYSKRTKLEDDKILTRILDLVKEKDLSSLKGRENKKLRNAIEKEIDNQVKAMTAEDGSSISIRDIRKLYDSIIKYLSPDASGNKMSDVSFDQCIRYADMFLKTIYPNLSPAEKDRVDSGNFPYGEVFSLVLASQNIRGEKTIDLDVVYEDEVIKIVYPQDANSFSEYAFTHKPDTPWKKPWCTLSPQTWSSYHADQFLAIAHVKEYYKKDHPLSLISLKISHEGNILYQASCDYYNKHMNLDFKQYLSEKAIKDCKTYFKAFSEKSKTKVNKYINEIDDLIRLHDKEGIIDRLSYIITCEYIANRQLGFKRKVEDIFSSLPASLFSEVVIEIACIANCFTYGDDLEVIKEKIRDILFKDIDGDRSIYKLFVKKACKRNLNPRYANSFVLFLNLLEDYDEKFKIAISELDANKVNLIISNCLNSNNPSFFEIAGFSYLPFLLNNVNASSEEKDEIYRSVFLSKSHIEYYKENFDKIKSDSGNVVIHNNLEVFADCHEEISRRANTELLDIEKIAKQIVLEKIKAECILIINREARNIRDTSRAYTKIENIFSSINSEYNTSITIEEFLLNYNKFVRTKLLVIIFDNNNDEFLRKNLREEFANILIRDIMRETHCLFNIQKFEDTIALLDKIIDIILRTNRSDIWEKLIEATASELEKIPGTSIGHGIYTAVFGTNIQFNQMSTEFAIKYPNMLSLYKIPDFKRKLQNRIIASKHEDIFKIIFIYSTEYKDVLTDSLFEDQIKFIKENFNFPTFINLLENFFIKEENGLFKLLSNEQKAKISAITKQYLDIDVFKKSTIEEPEELVRDYVKTQL